MSTLAEARQPSQAQRATGLGLAQQRRLERAALCAELKGLSYHQGLARIAELLADPPACIHKLDIEKLLLWVPRVGKAITNEALGTLRVTSNTYVGAMTRRQRLIMGQYIVASNDAERVAVLMERSNSRALEVNVSRVLKLVPNVADDFGATYLARMGVTPNTPLLALTDAQHDALQAYLGLNPTDDATTHSEALAA